MEQEKILTSEASHGQWSFFATPWEKHFLLRCHNSKKIIRFACPYIKLRNIRLILASLPSESQYPIRIELLTRLNLNDCRSRVHDISALQLLLDNPISNYCNIHVRVNNRLHAKLYIFDDIEAIITSSNLTYSGFNRNLEVALATDHKNVVETAISYFNDEFSKAKLLTNDLISAISDKLRLTITPRPLRQQKEVAQEFVGDSALSCPEPEELDVIDDDVIAEIDAKLSENLKKELVNSALDFEGDATASESIDLTSVQRFIEDSQKTFLAVLGLHVPSDEEILTIYAHTIIYNDLKIVKPDPKLANVWGVIGKAAFRTVVYELLVRSRPKSTAEDISTTGHFILESDHLVRQLNELGLCRILSRTHVLRDEQSIEGIARETAFKLIGFFILPFASPHNLRAYLHRNLKL